MLSGTSKRATFLKLRLNLELLIFSQFVNHLFSETGRLFIKSRATSYNDVQFGP